MSGGITILGVLAPRVYLGLSLMSLGVLWETLAPLPWETYLSYLPRTNYSRGDENY